MVNVLNEMGIKAFLTHSNTAFELTVKGMDNVLNLFNYLNKYVCFLYWKTESFNFLIWVSKLIKIGGHHTYFGLKALITKLYSITNERFTSKEIWDSRLEEWFVSERRKWGEYYITPIYSPSKEIRGWQVRFPISFKLPNKGFMCTTHGGIDKTFKVAIEYRNNILSSWIDNFIKNN